MARSGGDALRKCALRLRRLQVCRQFEITSSRKRDSNGGDSRVNDVLPHKHAHTQKVRDWRKSASDHVAYSLLVYTALQIFGTVHAMKSATDGSVSILPYLALIVLVAGIIPACRWFEKRWVALSEDRKSVV